MLRSLVQMSVVLAFLASATPAHSQWWKKATDGSIDPFNKNNDFGSYIQTPNIDVTPRYHTNKFDLKAKVEGGGWHVAWADDIAEKDVAQGAVAAGVSIYSANPAAFLAWVEALVDRTVASLERSGSRLPQEVRGEIHKLAASVISDALRGKGARELSHAFGDIGVKAGAIQYSGENKLGDQVISRTWGLKPYIAVRIARPNGQAGPGPVRAVGGPGNLAGLNRFRGQRTGTLFEHLQGAHWIARAPNGTVVADFEEVERTDNFVGLKSHSNFPHVRVFRDHTEEFVPHQSQNWVAVEGGGWQQ